VKGSREPKGEINGKEAPESLKERLKTVMMRGELPVRPGPARAGPSSRFTVGR